MCVPVRWAIRSWLWWLLDYWMAPEATLLLLQAADRCYCRLWHQTCSPVRFTFSASRASALPIVKFACTIPHIYFQAPHCKPSSKTL